jgi:hypothetical protein
MRVNGAIVRWPGSSKRPSGNGDAASIVNEQGAEKMFTSYQAMKLSEQCLVVSTRRGPLEIDPPGTVYNILNLRREYAGLSIVWLEGVTLEEFRAWRGELALNAERLRMFVAWKVNRGEFRLLEELPQLHIAEPLLV